MDRVKTLDNVVVKSTTFINDEDEMVLIPGPWAILKPASRTSTTSRGSPDLSEDLDEVLGTPDLSDSLESSQEGTVGAPSSMFNRFRSPSTTASNQQPFSRSPSNSLRRSSPNASPSNLAGKCVVRNEFGHARIQQYIVHPERVNVSYHVSFTVVYVCFSWLENRAY